MIEVSVPDEIPHSAVVALSVSIPVPFSTAPSKTPMSLATPNSYILLTTVNRMREYGSTLIYLSLEIISSKWGTTDLA